MAVILEAFALAAFTGAMAAAAFEDFRRLIIPNSLIIVLCAFWPVYFAAAPSVIAAAGAIGCAAAVFLGGAVLFSRGYVGGGDVKLLAAAALWAGPAGTPQLLLLTAILGGVLALFLLLPFGRRLTAMGRRLLRQPQPAVAERVMATPTPYGMAIAGAALIVTLLPHLG